jgi:hypothetical protein
VLCCIFGTLRFALGVLAIRLFIIRSDTLVLKAQRHVFSFRNPSEIHRTEPYQQMVGYFRVSRFVSVSFHPRIIWGSIVSRHLSGRFREREERLDMCRGEIVRVMDYNSRSQGRSRVTKREANDGIHSPRHRELYLVPHHQLSNSRTSTTP